MTRRLTDAQLTALFVGTFKETGGDVTSVARACERAGYTAAIHEMPRVRTLSEHGPHRSRMKLPTKAHVEAIRKQAAPVLAAVALAHGVSKEQLTGPRGALKVCAARHVAAWLLQQTGFALEDVSIALVRKNHSTSWNSIQAVEARIAETPAVRDELLALLPGRERRAA